MLAELRQVIRFTVAAVGGSWSFIITFGVLLIGWMLLNTDVLAHWNMAFDPYPYIFLNLMLSMLAAIQAPVIMMSHNRQGAKDRLAANLDYAVNLHAELEVTKTVFMRRAFFEEVTMTFRKLPVSVNSGPAAVYSASAGLAQAIRAGIALVIAVDSSLTCSAKTGILPSRIASTPLEGKKLINDFLRCCAAESVMRHTPCPVLAGRAKE